MDQEGGLPPPDGNRDLGPTLVGVNWAVFGPSWIFVILRSITRIWISRNFGWDDAVMVFAQVSEAHIPDCKKRRGVDVEK